MAYASAVVVNPVDVTSAGIVSTTLPTTPTATHGNKFYHDGRSYLEILNAGAELTATIDTPGTVDGLAVTDRTITVGAGARMSFYPNANYVQSDGYVWVTLSRVTDVTIGVFRLPQS